MIIYVHQGLYTSTILLLRRNYVKEGRRPRNGKQFEIIEFDGPQLVTKARVVAAQKSLSDYEDIYKINYSYGEAFDSGKILMKLVLTLSFMKIYFFVINW